MTGSAIQGFKLGQEHAAAISQAAMGAMRVAYRDLQNCAPRDGMKVGDPVFAFGRMQTVTREMLCWRSRRDCKDKLARWFAQHADVPVVLDTPATPWWRLRGWRATYRMRS